MELRKDPRSLRHGRLREAVLELAQEAARAGALEEVSIREFSRSLGVSPAAVYRHFPNREAILHAVAQSGFDRMAARFEAALPFASQAVGPADAVDRVIRLAVEYAAFAGEHYGLWRLMFGPYGRSGKAPQGRPATFEWLDKALRELRETGAIPAAGEDDRKFLWAAIHGLSDLEASGPRAGSDPQPAARALAVRALRGVGVADALLAGRGS